MSESDVRWPRIVRHHIYPNQGAIQQERNGDWLGTCNGEHKVGYACWSALDGEDLIRDGIWDETFDHHPAPVSEVPVNMTPEVAHQLAGIEEAQEPATWAGANAPDWQPFDGEFKQGVEYRSRDGVTQWRYDSQDDSCTYSITLYRLDNDKVGDFMPSGRYWQSIESVYDITHQRLRHAETGEGVPAADFDAVVEHMRETGQLHREPHSQPAAGREVPQWCKDAAHEICHDGEPNVQAAGKSNYYEIWVAEASKIIASHAPADYDALQERCESLKNTNREWLAANGPGGWIDDLRTQLAEANQRCEAAERKVCDAICWKDQAEAWKAVWDAMCNCGFVGSKSYRDNAKGRDAAVAFVYELDGKAMALTAERDRLAGELEAVRKAITEPTVSYTSVIDHMRHVVHKSHHYHTEHVGWCQAHMPKIEAALSPAAGVRG